MRPLTRQLDRIHPAIWVLLVAAATVVLCAGGTVVAAHIGGPPLPVDGGAP